MYNDVLSNIIVARNDSSIVDRDLEYYIFIISTNSIVSNQF